MAFLDNVTFIFVDINKYGGSAKADDQDYLPSGELPPEQLLGRGSKQVFPPSELAVFDGIKNAVKKVLLENGIRFMGG